MTLNASHQVLTLAPGEVIPAPSEPRTDFVEAVCVYCGRPGRISTAQVGQAVACPRCRRFQIVDVAPMSRPAFLTKG